MASVYRNYRLLPKAFKAHNGLLVGSLKRTALLQGASLSQPRAPQPQARCFGATAAARMLPNPVNLPKWLEENSHLLKPPINNYCVYNEDITVMIVGGPNARTDYHINQTPEWFYQYKGAMLLKVVDKDDQGAAVFRDVVIREGDMFLLPSNTPHNPVRFADTVGVVLEQRRPEGSVDRMRWYCQNCRAVVHEAAFHCTDLGTQIKAAVEAFRGSEEARTCKACGELADWCPKPGSIKDPNKE